MEQPKKLKRGPIPVQDQREYRARLKQWGTDAQWGRPTEATASAVWNLLEDHLPCTLRDLLPQPSRAKEAFTPEELAEAILAAKQSLVVALDCAVSSAGELRTKRRRDRTAMLTFNRVFAALAERWSITFRQSEPACSIYDMAPEKIPTIYHELRYVVRLDTLLEIVGLPWKEIKSEAKNPLYGLRWVPKGRRWVRLRHRSLTLAAFDRLIRSDPQYRRRGARRILFAEDWTPQDRPVRQRVCAEQPYVVVNLERNSERTLGHLEAARVAFNIDTFREDYKALLRKRRKSRTAKDEGLLSAFRPVYIDTKGMSGVRHIRSRFFRAVNRRYHAANFWPEYVPKTYRERWVALETLTFTDGPVYEPPSTPADFTALPSGPNDLSVPYLMVALDVSSSQTQILAVFLGLNDLEELARSRTPKFKVWLAQRLWALHEATPGGLLGEGYDGPEDQRLIEFVKATWMRYLYGSSFKTIAKKLAREPKKYGVGWKTTRALDAKAIPAKRAGGPLKSGIQEAALRAQSFFDSLPEWRIPLNTYLDACRSLGTVEGGVVFEDPWDGAEVRWNPAQRARTFVPVGKHKADVRPWGYWVDKVGFVPAPPGTVDTAKLRTFVAPCLIHTLDAFFNSLVIEGLVSAGISDFVAIHDGWWVPDLYAAAPDSEDDPEISNGGQALLAAIERAGKPWLEGLRGVYEALESYFGPESDYGQFIKDIRAKWDARLARSHWPRFTTG